MILYIGTHTCVNEPIYDLIHFSEVVRRHSANYSLKHVEIDRESIAFLLSSFIGVYFNILLSRSSRETFEEAPTQNHWVLPGQDKPNFLTDSDFKARLKLIKSNIDSIETIKSYSNNQLNLSSRLDLVEREILIFKKKCLFEVTADLFIYELDISDIVNFMSAGRGSEQKDCLLQVLTYAKHSLTIINYIIQMLFNIDVLWSIGREKVRQINKLQIAHFIDPLAGTGSSKGLRTISRNSLLVFVGIGLQPDSLPGPGGLPPSIPSLLDSDNAVRVVYKKVKDLKSFGSVRAAEKEFHSLKALSPRIEILTHGLHEYYQELDCDQKFQPYMLREGIEDCFKGSRNQIGEKDSSEVQKANLMKSAFQSFIFGQKDIEENDQATTEKENRFAKVKDRLEQKNSKMPKTDNSVQDKSELKGENPDMMEFTSMFDNLLKNPKVSGENQKQNQAQNKEAEPNGMAQLLRGLKKKAPPVGVDFTSNRQGLLDFIKSSQLQENDLNQDKENEISITTQAGKSIDSYLQDIATKIFKPEDQEGSKNSPFSKDPNAVEMKLKSDAQGAASRFDDIFANFKELAKTSINFDDLMLDSYDRLKEENNRAANSKNKNEASRNVLTKTKAKIAVLESFKQSCLSTEDFKDFVDLENRVKSLYQELFLLVIPSIYRAKYAGKIKEEERFTSQEAKYENLPWETKLEALKDFYNVTVVNFEGKLNSLIEQIFSIVNMNYYPILRLLEYHPDLVTSARILSFAHSHLGGLNSQYFTSLCLQICDLYFESFLAFFFGQFIPTAAGFFSIDWSAWIGSIRAAGLKHPGAAIFLNAFRLLMMGFPETTSFCIKLVDCVGKVCLAQKTEAPSGFSKQVHTIRARSGLSPRMFLSIESLEEILLYFSITEMAESICTCEHISQILNKIHAQLKDYLESKNMDIKNIGLVFFFLQIYGILLPHILQVTRVTTDEHELHYQYIFMAPCIMNPSFSVAGLESNLTTISYHLLLLDFVACCFPSLITSMMSTQDMDVIDRALDSYTFQAEGLQDDSNKNRVSRIVSRDLSVFADRMVLAPADDFFFFLNLLLEADFDSSSWAESYPTTFTLLDITLETLQANRAALRARTKAFLEKDMQENNRVLIFVSTNLTSLFNNSQIVGQTAELYPFLESKDNLVDRFTEAFELVTHRITLSQSENPLSEAENLEHQKYISSPAVISDTRSVSHFLFSAVNQDYESREVLEKFIDNCGLYLLSKVLDSDAFERTFSKELDGFASNTTFLKQKMDKIPLLKKVSETMVVDFRLIERNVHFKRVQLKFAEESYLKGFLKT